MLTLSAITEILKSNNTPYWRLYMRAGYSKPNLISAFMTEPERRKRDEESAAENEKDQANTMAQSIDQLTRQVQFYSQTPNVVFSIEYRPAPKSSDIRGLIDFVLDNAAASNVNQIQQPQQPFSGFSGFAQSDFSSQLEGRLEIERERNRLELEKVNFEHEKKRELDKIIEERRKLAEEKEKLKELEAEYLSDSQRAKNGFSMAIKGLIDQYLPGTEEKGLKGVETEVAAIPLTPEEQMIQSIAGLVHEQFKDLEDIKVFGVLAQRFAENRELFESYKHRAFTNQL